LREKGARGMRATVSRKLTRNPLREKGRNDIFIGQPRLKKSLSMRERDLG
jgi:hypothetical protein